MIYILKFDQRLGNLSNPRGQAQYYVGFCKDNRFDDRMNEHRAGHGAAIIRAAIAKGILFKVIYTMRGNRDNERNIKRQKNTPRLVERLKRDGYIDSGI